MRILFSFSIVILLFGSCTTSSFKKEVSVKNTLDIDRTEVISLPISLLDTLPEGFTWTVKSGDNDVVSQRIDYDGDSKDDVLIFQVELKANEGKAFTLISTDKKIDINTPIKTFSRFVPERIDDYAWENDLVAFRTYGPEAQRLVDDGEKGGTLSSGMDCWLKRVNYPVIDKWYKKYTEGGTYHKDDGEGYDPYHVGASRGCGGIGVWQNDSLFVSKNFISYKKIAEGPIRNIFELTYAPWQADGVTINETKRITIDLGNQVYKVEDNLKVSGVLPNVTIGITLHEGKGKAFADSVNGVFGYWEPIDDSEIGTGVVIDPSTLLAYEEYRTTKKDLSQLHVRVKPENEIRYFAGFAWKKTGAIQTQEEWSKYLTQFSQRLWSPVEIMTR
jgi:hypothetical protein